MLKYILRRILQLIGVLLVLSILLFAWLRSLPGGPVTALLGERATPADRVALEQSLGMNDPLWLQYVRFLNRAIHGEFGPSTGVFPGHDALDIFLTRVPATIGLSVFAMTVAIILGIPLGYYAARRRRGILDTASVLASLVGVAVPVFFLAFLLKYEFAVQLHWFPVSGRQSALDATRVTGFFVVDGLLTREWAAAWDALKHMILPGLALSTIPFSVIFRITRGAVLEVLDEDFVRTAEAKGLASRVITRRHVMRNALLPVITMIGLQMGGLLSGAVLTETVFSYGGVGEALAIAFAQRDYAVLQVLVLAAALTYVVVNLLVDISYAFVDPRLRVR